MHLDDTAHGMFHSPQAIHPTLIPSGMEDLNAAASRMIHASHARRHIRRDVESGLSTFLSEVLSMFIHS
jgi:hypothetical protein